MQTPELDRLCHQIETEIGVMWTARIPPATTDWHDWVTISEENW